MRMDPTNPTTAHDLVNKLPRQELTKIIREYGEERWASRIAEFIDKYRQQQPIHTTGQLVSIIKAAIPKMQGAKDLILLNARFRRYVLRSQR